MEREFKIKNKYSYSPNRTTENVFTMKARIGKKPKHFNTKLILDLNSENNRHFSQSAHKSKYYGHKLFSGAHRIDSRETYLLNEKVQKESKTKESSTPMSPLTGKYNSIRRSSDQKIIRSTSSLKVHGKGLKDIQRTVSIAIKGNKEDLPSEEKLMATLTDIILGGQKSRDELYLQIVGESSIHGEQQNFIELDSFIFKDHELTQHPKKQKE